MCEGTEEDALWGVPLDGPAPPRLGTVIVPKPRVADSVNFCAGSESKQFSVSNRIPINILYLKEKHFLIRANIGQF